MVIPAVERPAASVHCYPAPRRIGSRDGPPLLPAAPNVKRCNFLKPTAPSTKGIRAGRPRIAEREFRRSMLVSNGMLRVSQDDGKLQSLCYFRRLHCSSELMLQAVDSSMMGVIEPIHGTVGRIHVVATCLLHKKPPKTILDEPTWIHYSVHQTNNVALVKGSEKSAKLR